MTKQTAGNNTFLRETKKQYAEGAYKHVARVLNEHGEAAAKATLENWLKTGRFLED